MYTITLQDGTELRGLELNGNNYIAGGVIDDAVFAGNLGAVTITDGETTESYADMVLIQNTANDGRSWFILAEKTEEEKRREAMALSMELASIAFVATAESSQVADAVIAEHPEQFGDWMPDAKYTAGQIRRYGGALYRCRQAHDSLAHQPPDTVPALWSIIDVEHAGTLDDPIPAAVGMEYYKDKYYSEAGALYLCTRGTGQPVYHLPSALVGQFFERV